MGIGKVSEILVHRNKGAWLEVRDQLNRLLRGWTDHDCWVF